MLEFMCNPALKMGNFGLNYNNEWKPFRNFLCDLREALIFNPNYSNKIIWPQKEAGIFMGSSKKGSLKQLESKGRNVIFD